MSREGIEAKGERFVRQGRVKSISPAWLVTGDTGQYAVYADEEGKVHCTCPSTYPCSHMAALYTLQRSKKNKGQARQTRA